MPSGVFTGAAFAIKSVVQMTMASIRLTFTNDPEAVNPAGPHDALNPSLYSLTGPSLLTVTAATTVPGDTRSVDLVVSLPFTTGTWTISCTAIQMLSGTAMVAPTAMSFAAIYGNTQADVNGGAVSDTAATVIRKHLNPYLKGNVWNSLIAALATGDETNWTNARSAFDQLFTSSASGIYLDRRGADAGVARPQNIGMPDEIFRKYAIKLTNHKLTQESLWEILETFYGSDSVRAFAETDLTSPFALHDQDSLTILFDESKIVNIVLDDSQFGVVGSASALEVAAAITRACERQACNGYAVSISDPTTGLDKVRIYSPSLGLGSSVRITSGTAQPYLRFPSYLTVATAVISGADAYSWVATLDADGDSTTFSLTKAFPVKMDLSQVQTGDWVIIDAAASGMPAGIYNVLDVSVTYAGANIVQSFVVDGNALESLGLPTKTATQLSRYAYQFFRPTRATIQRAFARTVLINQSEQNAVDIQLPATTQAVGRHAGSAAYVNTNLPVPITSLTRIGDTVSVLTTGINTIAAGEQILVDDAYGNRVGPPIIAGGASTANSSLSSLWSVIQDNGIAAPTLGATVVALSDNSAIKIGGSNLTLMTPATSACTVFYFTAAVPGPLGEAGWDYADDSASMYGLVTARAYHKALKLLDGRILVIGGRDIMSVELGTMEVIDSILDAFIATASSLTTPRSWPEAVELSTGEVVIVGGFNVDQSLDSIQVYDPISDTIGVEKTMTRSRVDHAIAALPNGTVLITGGKTFAPGSGETTDTVGNFGNASPTYTCEIFDPATGLCTPTGSMAYSRNGHELVTLPDGRIMVIGGFGRLAGHVVGSGVVLPCEVYDPTTGAWSVACHLTYGHIYPTAFLLPNSNKILVALGMDITGTVRDLNQSEYIDAATFKVSPVPNPCSVPATLFGYRNASCLLAEDKVFYSSGEMALWTNLLFVGNGEDVIGSAGLNGQFRVDTADAAGFTYKTPDNAHYTSTDGTAIITPVKAAATVGNLGPFIFDPTAAPAMTGTSTVTTSELVKGHGYALLNVADASAFPDEEGWICLAFGTSNQMAPVHYLGLYSPTQLILDYTATMTETMPVGTNVVLLAQKGPYSPGQGLGSFYLTSSPAGRAAAIAALDMAVAAGVEVRTTTVYPGDRGLGGEGLPVTGKKIADKVGIFAEDQDEEISIARGEN